MSEEENAIKKECRPLRIQLSTFGCQMNSYDTEVAEGLLGAHGFTVLPENGGEGPVPDADVVLMNTCSVRAHAEERVFGRLGMLGKAKRKNPDLIVGLMGCMVESYKEQLFKRFPQLDLMVGTRNIKDLPALIEDVRVTRQQAARIKQDGLSIEYTEHLLRKSRFHAWLPIMTGCDKTCTYCIVPITRGREVSMPAREVYREASRLVSEGVKWITLLGQNVNSYRGGFESVPVSLPQPFNGNGKNDKSVIKDSGDDRTRKITRPVTPSSFPELLEMLCEIDGLEQISFTTSHPHDATEPLFQMIARNPKISRRFHLPLQSGSDAVLKRMARLHKYEEFRNKVERLRALVPDVSITTDIIAGFSGETEEDHAATMSALRELRFDSAFIYKYSIRPGTPAERLRDDVAHDIKERRNQELLALQKQIAAENAKRLIGQTVRVFAEAVSSKREDELIGRTTQDRRVVFRGTENQIGQFIQVQLKSLRHETFSGDVIDETTAKSQ